MGGLEGGRNAIPFGVFPADGHCDLHFKIDAIPTCRVRRREKCLVQEVTSKCQASPAPDFCDLIKTSVMRSQGFRAWLQDPPCLFGRSVWLQRLPRRTHAQPRVETAAWSPKRSSTPSRVQGASGPSEGKAKTRVPVEDRRALTSQAPAPLGEVAEIPVLSPGEFVVRERFQRGERPASPSVRCFGASVWAKNLARTGPKSATQRLSRVRRRDQL